MLLTALDSFVLTAQAALLWAIGLRLRDRLHTGEDFILGRRRMGAPLSEAALAMNSVPMWWLLALTGAAYTLGLAAIWLALALVGGVVLGGWYVAPRLRALTNLQQRGTFSELLIGGAGQNMRALLVRSTLLIITLTLIFSSAVQLQIAAQILKDAFEWSFVIAVITLGFVLYVSLLLAGFWTTAIVDIWQIVVWIAACVTALIAVIMASVQAPNATPSLLRGDWFADQQGLLTLSFTLGIAFIASDVAGQAPLLARFMACKDDAELARGRRYALLWTALSLSFALALGFGVRALSDASTLSIAVLTDALSRTISPTVVSIFVLLIFGAATAAIGSSLQTAASHLANELRRGGTPASLLYCRLGLTLVVLLAVLMAIYMPIASGQRGIERLLLCWHALGAAFGPLLIVRLSGKRVRPGSTLGSIWSGFLLTLVFYLMPDTPGELLERGLPFTAALGIALSGGERRRNPDRADRGDRTVHDRLPI